MKTIHPEKNSIDFSAFMCNRKNLPELMFQICQSQKPKVENTAIGLAMASFLV
jgi:hypothetical protein